MHLSPDVLEAYAVARAAQSRAHAPYSKFKVGAAVRVRGEASAVAGCNVENASFGATVCAERTAIQGAVARGGPITLEFLVVVVTGPVSVPCALCLQVIAEFAGDDLPIYLGNADGISRVVTLGELLPQAFRSFVAGGPA